MMLRTAVDAEEDVVIVDNDVVCVGDSFLRAWNSWFTMLMLLHADDVEGVVDVDDDNFVQATAF